MSEYKIEIVPIKKPSPEINVIIGHSHFIKTVEDLYEALVNSVPGIKFGIAFCEASGKRLIRYDGTDEELVKYAIENAKKIAAGHTFIIMLRNAYPINVLNAIKNTYEVCRIYAATANPLQVVVIETDQGRGVIGVVDGYTPLGVEGDEDIKERKEFLRTIGYKR
ncbi:MAG TPA: adenosine monophosphate-protein transferase [Euryarchaeota archaeon]|nr:adenosine monophosphate-protein transferase [Euryarchaeota archaeon]